MPCVSSTIISARVLVVIIIFCGKLTCIIADDAMLADVSTSVSFL